MSILTISRGSFSGGVDFAERISRKLGWRCISREELSEEAIRQGIPVGKLQTAMVRPPRIQQRLGPTRDYYLACITSILCKYALEEDIVYHGHTGHMLFPGIPNIFRVRVLAEMDHRVQKVMERLNLSQEKAIQYVQDVDADRDKWVRYLYGIDWHDPSHYDLVVNLDHVSAANSTTALCSMAELPEFKLTPGSVRALQDLYLASRAKFLLAGDERTDYADFKVTAHNGEIQVTCNPQHAEAARFVHSVLEKLEGYSKINRTIAGSNILWLGERFDVDPDLLPSVLRVAHNWDAAVEVMSCCSMEEMEREQKNGNGDGNGNGQSHRQTFERETTGGIQDDVPVEAEEDCRGLHPVLDTLLREGCAGGQSKVYGDKETLIRTLGHRTNYSLVVLGDLYLDKPDTVQARLKADLRSLLSESIKAPVVDADELKHKAGYKKLDYIKLAVYLAVAAILFTLVFLNQDTVLHLLSETSKGTRVFVIIGLCVFTPLFAFSWGSGTKTILRMLGVH